MTRSITTSIVITSFNQKEFIAQAIDSALNQKDALVEVIVIDDGSNDGSQDFLQRYFGKSITLIKQDNQGPSCAVNAGIRIAQGKYISLLGGDDLCYPTRISKQVDYLQQTRFDMVFCIPDLIDASGKTIDESEFPTFLRKLKDLDFFRTFLIEGNFLCAPSVTFRRDVIERVGYFKAGLIQLQDFEYWIRCVLAGMKIGRLDEKLIAYRRHANNLSGSSLLASSVEEAEIFDSLLEHPKAQRELRRVFKNMIVPCHDVDLPLTDIDKMLICLGHRNPQFKSLGAMRGIRMYENSEFRLRLQELGIAFTKFLKNSLAA